MTHTILYFLQKESNVAKVHNKLVKWFFFTKYNCTKFNKFLATTTAGVILIITYIQSIKSSNVSLLISLVLNISLYRQGWVNHDFKVTVIFTLHNIASL